MITLTTNQLLSLKVSLEKLIEHTEKNPLNFRATLKFSRIIDQVQTALFSYEKRKNNLIQTLGESTKVKDSNGIEVDGYEIKTNSKNFMEYMEKSEFLLKEENEILNVFPFKEEELDELKIPISLMPGLLCLIENKIIEKSKSKKVEEDQKEKSEDIDKKE